jgi:hypothetical protein
MVTPSWPGRWIQFFPHRVRVLDVRILAALVAAAQQQVERLAGSRVVNAVARAEVDAHLAQALADGPISPGLPLANRSIRAWIFVRPFESLSPLSHPSKASVRFTSNMDALYTIGGAL